MTTKTRFLVVLAVILATASLRGQQPEPPVPPSEPAATSGTQTPPATEPEPAPATPAQPTTTPAPTTPGILSDAASSTYERRDTLPAVNIYLPEGQASVRLRKLIRNVLFESQIDYEFVNGDISTFLRYKYYARNYTYRIGVFDSIEFPDLTSDDSNEYERVRGGLLLIGVPKDYDSRWFLLMQNDQLTFGDLARPDNQTSNIYAKVGYQYGTQFDERMNAIVGEQRGRITPVLTAFREIGPQRTGLAAAITQATNVWSADYSYTKFEVEGLRRFDITSTSFLFSRLHLGSFLSYEDADPAPLPRDRDGDDEIDPVPEWERYAIPQYELFRLGGREALKSISGNDTAVGTHEIHLTNEVFVPVFRNKNYKVGSLYWNTLYAIGYLGTGTVGFARRPLEDDEDPDTPREKRNVFQVLSDTKRFVVDVGIGTESAITFGDYDVFLSVVYAQPIRRPDSIDKGRGIRFSVRTVR